MTTELIRGTADIGMTQEGINQVRQAGEIIKEAGGVDLIFHSNLERCVVAARMISNQLGGTELVNLGNRLDPWHLGSFEGRPVDVANRAIKYYVRHSTEQVPGRGIRGDSGESFLEFKTRLLSTIDQLISRYINHRICVIGNYRTLAMTSAWVASGMPPDFSIVESFMFQSGIETGEVMLINIESKTVKILKEGSNKQKGPGLFMVRHGETPWNAPNDKEKKETSHSGS